MFVFHECAIEYEGEILINGIFHKVYKCKKCGKQKVIAQ